MKSPVAYRWIKYAGNRLRYGVNFAYGGTGVFDTLVLEPNMTTQIDFFEKLLKDLVYNKTDLDSSLFLVTVAGNDYGAYNAKGGTAKVNLPSAYFIEYPSLLNSLRFSGVHYKAKKHTK